MTGHLPEPAAIDHLGVLFAAYQYELGNCFRCSRRAVQVTRVGEITSIEGETPLYACRACVQEFLTQHDRMLERTGRHRRIVQIPRAPRGAEAT